MSLLDDLGIDPEHLQWFQLSLCDGMEINWFYDLYESDQEVAKAIDATCLACPVIRECYQFAEDNNEFGVWGGVYWTNGKQDRAKNAHKTPEVIKAIAEKCL